MERTSCGERGSRYWYISSNMARGGDGSSTTFAAPVIEFEESRDAENADSAESCAGLGGGSCIKRDTLSNDSPVRESTGSAFAIVAGTWPPSKHIPKP